MIAVSQKSWHYWFADAAGISMKTVGGGEVNLCTYVSHVGFGIVIVCSALALTSLAVFAAYLLVAAALAGAMYILNGFAQPITEREAIGVLMWLCATVGGIAWVLIKCGKAIVNWSKRRGHANPSSQRGTGLFAVIRHGVRDATCVTVKVIRD